MPLPTDHTIDYLSDQIEECRVNMFDTLRQVQFDYESERISWEDEISEAIERAVAAEQALREVLDRLDDWHRGLCDRDEVITGPMIRELVSERFSIKSVNQEVRDWTPGKE